MRKSKKHAIAQRLVAAVGLLLFLAPILVTELHSTPSFVLILGFILLAFAIISSMGFGSWGRVNRRAILSRLGVETASNSFHLSMSPSSVLTGGIWSVLHGYDL